VVFLLLVVLARHQVAVGVAAFAPVRRQFVIRALVGGHFALQQGVLERFDVVGRGAFDHGLERLRQLGAFAGLGMGDDVVDGLDLRIARGGRAVLDDEALDAAGGARRRHVAGCWAPRRFSGCGGLGGGLGCGLCGHSGLLGVVQQFVYLQPA
jgi:hypothetical protein